MWRMSRRTPDGKAPCVANGMLTGGCSDLATATGGVCTTGDAQHAHVQRTQNAGQPLSGLDSLVPTPQVSGTTSELRPLASAHNRARRAMRSARRIRLILQHANPGPIGAGPLEWRHVDWQARPSMTALLAHTVAVSVPSGDVAVSDVLRSVAPWRSQLFSTRRSDRTSREKLVSCVRLRRCAASVRLRRDIRPDDASARASRRFAERRADGAPADRFSIFR